MKKGFALTALVLLLFAGICFSAEAKTPNDLSWAGGMKVFLNKTSFSETEGITGEIELFNAENYPLIGGQIVLQLAQGAFEYPSQLSGNDNVLLETIIEKDIWILPKQTKKIPFSLGPQKTGAYRIDAYSWATKSKLIGASNIFFAPVSKAFNVTGGQEYKRTIIDRKLTTFNGAVGPVGFPVKPGEQIFGEITVVNKSSSKKTNLELKVGICEWALPFCANLQETKVNVPDLAPNESTKVKVSIQAPQIPSAYEINMVLSSNNSIESIYKNRAIVSGGTAKVRKIFLSGLDSKNYSLNIVFAGSPDHFSTPVFDGFELLVQVFNNKALSEEKTVKIKSIKTGEVMQEAFGFSSKYFDEFCVKITKSSTVYDAQCYGVDLQKIQSGYDVANPKVIDVKWDYDEATSALTLTLEKEKINAQVRVFSTDATLYLEKINVNGKFTKTISVPKENLTLAVDDFDAKQQKLFALNFGVAPEKRELAVIGEPVKEENTFALEDCKAVVCSNGSACSAPTKETAQGACCYSECISSIALIEGTEVLGVPLIAWAAAILLVIALIIAANALAGVKKK